MVKIICNCMEHMFGPHLKINHAAYEGLCLFYILGFGNDLFNEEINA